MSQHQHKAYFSWIGFFLSVILTIMAFKLVAQHHLSNETLYIVVAVLAVVQLILQALFFLRLNNKTKGDYWNWIAFIFMLIIITIVISGSLWIMYNLNYNMVN
jgi:cytochrome o ubiquinol oxidase operon protein cyoD